MKINAASTNVNTFILFVYIHSNDKQKYLHHVTQKKELGWYKKILWTYQHIQNKTIAKRHTHTLKTAHWNRNFKKKKKSKTGVWKGMECDTKISTIFFCLTHKKEINELLCLYTHNGIKYCQQRKKPFPLSWRLLEKATFL